MGNYRLSTRQLWRLKTLAASLAILPTLAFSAVLPDCEVAIIGGGPGGLHTAYQLTKPGNPSGIAANRICLFEKKPHLGGRIEDIDFSNPTDINPSPTDNNVVGTGAYRFQQNHYTYDLMKQFKVDFKESFDSTASLGLAPHPPYTNGNLFGYGASDFFKPYDATLTDDDVWNKLLCGAQTKPDTKGCPRYATLMSSKYRDSTSLSYLNSLISPTDAALFTDMFRFHADFYPLNLDPRNSFYDTVAYLEYNARDWNTGPTLYAIPGFSALVNKLAQSITGHGGRIYPNQTVTFIDRFNINSSNEHFILTMQNGDVQNTVRAKRVIIATTHGAIKDMASHIGGGNVIGTITDALEYKMVAPVSAVTITNKWAGKWWERRVKPDSALEYPVPPAPELAAGEPPILRTNTTIRSDDGYCLNSLEFPYTTHQNDLRITRTVYVDIPPCVHKWLKLWNNGANIAGTNAQIRNVLRKLYPNVFDRSGTEPKLFGTTPSLNNTHLTYHPEGWYYLKKGAFKRGITNQKVLGWSLSPIPGAKLYLVGDAWNNEFSSWSNGAYLSSIAVLNQHFHFNIKTRPLPNVHCADGVISDDTTPNCPALY